MDGQVVESDGKKKKKKGKKKSPGLALSLSSSRRNEQVNNGRLKTSQFILGPESSI